MKEVEKESNRLQLMRAGLFDKVAILCQAIGRYGLLMDKSIMTESLSSFRSRENESCIGFVYDPEACHELGKLCDLSDGNWYCLLVSEDDQNSVMLGFSTETGDLMKVNR